MFFNRHMAKQILVRLYHETAPRKKKKKRNRLLIHVKTWVDLEIIMLSEKSQPTYNYITFSE